MPLLQLPALALLWLSTAQAPADAAQVRWSSPPGCPGRAELLASIARRRGRPLAGEATVDARIDGRPGDYTLHLTLVAGARSETREDHDPSCAALTEAVALRVVAALESPAVVPAPPVSTVEAATTPEPAPGPSTSTTSSTSTSSTSTSSTPASSPSAIEAEPADATPVASETSFYDNVPGDMSSGPGAVLRLHGGGEVGAVPGPTGAVGVALGLLWPRLRLELQGAALAPRTAGAGSTTVRAGLYAGAVHGCARLGRGALELPLCVGLEVGAVRGEASRLPGARPAASWWVAAVLAPGVAWHARPRLSVWASVQLVLAAVRPEFVRGEGDAAEPIFRPGAASGRLLLGVELRLRDRW